MKKIQLALAREKWTLRWMDMDTESSEHTQLSSAFVVPCALQCTPEVIEQHTCLSLSAPTLGIHTCFGGAYAPCYVVRLMDSDKLQSCSAQITIMHLLC